MHQRQHKHVIKSNITHVSEKPTVGNTETSREKNCITS